jgi:hypothetical protein
LARQGSGTGFGLENDLEALVVGKGSTTLYLGYLPPKKLLIHKQYFCTDIATDLRCFLPETTVSFCLDGRFCGDLYSSGKKGAISAFASCQEQTATVLSSVAEPDPRSGALLTPGSGMGKKSRSESGMNIPDHIT